MSVAIIDLHSKEWFHRELIYGPLALALAIAQVALFIQRLLEHALMEALKDR